MAEEEVGARAPAVRTQSRTVARGPRPAEWTDVSGAHGGHVEPEYQHGDPTAGAWYCTYLLLQGGLNALH